ncbi:MAG: hypothetical protein ACOYJG_04015 [Prevotella sp.]|jgi:hypothetical protein
MKKVYIEPNIKVMKLGAAYLMAGSITQNTGDAETIDDGTTALDAKGIDFAIEDEEY